MNGWKGLALALVVLYWGALAVGTHLPGGGGVPTRGLDKLLHAGAFCGLALFLSAAWAGVSKLDRKAALAIVLLGAIYGAVDEVTQGYVPGRTPDFWDWLADLVGAACGAALGWLLFGQRGEAAAPAAASAEPPPSPVPPTR